MTNILYCSMQWEDSIYTKIDATYKELSFDELDQDEEWWCYFLAFKYI